MSSVHEIEAAVSKLSRQELLAFRDWFSGFDAAAWDKKFEEDVAAGRLDARADEAIRDLREGRSSEIVKNRTKHPAFNFVPDFHGLLHNFLKDGRHSGLERESTTP